MHAGKVVEAGDRENVFLHPRHPYTQMLISGKEEMPNRTGSMEEKPFQWIDLPKDAAFITDAADAFGFAPCTNRQFLNLRMDTPHPAGCIILWQRKKI